MTPVVLGLFCSGTGVIYCFLFYTAAKCFRNNQNNGEGIDSDSFYAPLLPDRESLIDPYIIPPNLKGILKSTSEFEKRVQKTQTILNTRRVRFQNEDPADLDNIQKHIKRYKQFSIPRTKTFYERRSAEGRRMNQSAGDPHDLIMTNDINDGDDECDYLSSSDKKLIDSELPFLMDGVDEYEPKVEK